MIIIILDLVFCCFILVFGFGFGFGCCFGYDYGFGFEFGFGLDALLFYLNLLFIDLPGLDSD
jgi:hypothetical protein